MEFPTIISITESVIDLDLLLARVTVPTTGATAIFTGIVREKSSGEKNNLTQYLDYEAYQPMAESKMWQIADEIRERWPIVKGILITQRIGRLLPGTVSTVIICSSEHRDAGIFEAAKYGIDRLKEIVPIWKKETGLQGEQWVEGHYHPRPGE
jgi:MoaE-MoaD fusion protein